MSDLFSALSSAARSLEAQRFALDVTGHNIANVSTPGYARRVVDFHAVPPEAPGAPGRGVEVAGIRAERDRLVERRLGQEITSAERESTIADLLGLAEVTLRSGQGIDSKLNAFFDSLATLAEAPTSMVARQEVVAHGGELAAAFRETVGWLEELGRDANRQLEGAVGEINELAARIAALNAGIGDAVGTTSALHIQDEQAQLLRELAALTDINVVEYADGHVDIDIAGGRALVVGANAYTLDAVTTGPNGDVAIELEGVDLTSQLTNGKIGGLLRVRDTHIPAYVQRLDEQAYALATAVNDIHTNAFDLNGNTGQAFFAFTTPPVGSAGAASAIVVDPAVAADATLVAAAAAALPGDNRAARDLADLRHALLLDGGTATLADGFGELVFRVGRDAATAASETDLRRQIVNQLEVLRDQTSGVSLDEEAMNLMKFQRAYEANARFFQVIDEALQTLLNAVGR